MRKLAFGIAAAVALLTAVPAMAQVGFYAGPGGVGVQFGAPYGYYDYYGSPYGYYDYWRPGVVVHPGWRIHRFHHYRHHHWRD